MIDSTDLSNVVAAQVVVFSSVAALIGAGGQASYVSANAGLDAWAQRRCDTGVWGGRVRVWVGGGASYVSANAWLDSWAQRRCDVGGYGGRRGRVCGGEGQAIYLSANAGLDKWAHRRCDTGGLKGGEGGGGGLSKQGRQAGSTCAEGAGRCDGRQAAHAQRAQAGVQAGRQAVCSAG